MQVKITIPNEIYNQIKNHAKEDMRTVNQEINYLLKLITNSYTPGSLPISPTSIITPAPGIPEYPYQVTATTTTTTAGLAQTPVLNIEQLQEQGVSQIKFNKPTTARQLSPEEEELHQAKLQQQLSRIKQQRVKFLKQKSNEILGYTLQYLEDNNQKTIDWVLNKYPTDEDIIAYLQTVKQEDEENEDDCYADPQTEEQLEPQNEYYQKIKRYYTQYLEPCDFDDLIDNAKVKAIDYLKECHQLNMFDALGVPHAHSWSDDEWNEIVSLLTE